MCRIHKKSYCSTMLYLFISHITVNLSMQWYTLILYIDYMVLIWLHTVLYFTCILQNRSAWEWFGRTCTLCSIFSFILTINKNILHVKNNYLTMFERNKTEYQWVNIISVIKYACFLHHSFKQLLCPTIDTTLHKLSTWCRRISYIN